MTGVQTCALPISSPSLSLSLSLSLSGVIVLIVLGAVILVVAVFGVYSACSESRGALTVVRPEQQLHAATPTLCPRKHMSSVGVVFFLFTY